MNTWLTALKKDAKWTCLEAKPTFKATFLQDQIGQVRAPEWTIPRPEIILRADLGRHRCQSSRAADTWATAQSPAARSASAVGRPRRRSPCGWARRRGWRIGSAVVWRVRRARSGRRSARSSTSTWGACARKSSPPGWSSAPGSTEARRTGTRFRQRVTRRT